MKVAVYRNYALLCIALIFIGCATSLTPLQMNSTLPGLTKSKYITRQQAEEGVKEGKGKYLVRGRNYASPLGLTAKEDLKYGAVGIDEWVKLDSGNAYVLNHYKWIHIDGVGTSQLHLDFDTYLLNQ
jgi:hypothetical protein